MNSESEEKAPAETFMAVVATALPEKVKDFDADASTRCGSGMARVRDD